MYIVCCSELSTLRLCNWIHSIQFCLLRWGKLTKVWDMGVKVRLDHMLVADASPSPSWEWQSQWRRNTDEERKNSDSLHWTLSRIPQPDERLVFREKITNVLVFGKDYIHTSIMSSKLWLSELSPFGFLFGFSRLLFSYEIISLIEIKVIHNVWRLGGENSQFRHNRGIKWIIGKEISQNEITGTQTSFSTKFGDKRSFFPLSWAPSLLLHKFSTTCTTIIITLEPCALDTEFQHFILRYNKNFFFLADTTERRG